MGKVTHATAAISLPHIITPKAWKVARKIGTVISSILSIAIRGHVKEFQFARKVNIAKAAKAGLESGKIIW